jgi:hypothetical protein
VTPEEYNKLDLEGKINYWYGQFCLAIGEGKSRRIIATLLMDRMTETYERGKQEGLRIARERAKEKAAKGKE